MRQERYWDSGLPTAEHIQASHGSRFRFAREIWFLRSQSGFREGLCLKGL